MNIMMLPKATLGGRIPIDMSSAINSNFATMTPFALPRAALHQARKVRSRLMAYNAFFEDWSPLRADGVDDRQMPGKYVIHATSCVWQPYTNTEVQHPIVGCYSTIGCKWSVFVFVVEHLLFSGLT